MLYALLIILYIEGIRSLYDWLLVIF